MKDNSGYSPESKTEVSLLKRNLPDILTLTRLVTGFIILGMSFAGKSVYSAVVIITLAGAATDIFDGRAARRYLRDKEGRLGKYDIEVDTVFLLCVLGYFSFSGVVISRAVGLGWIALVLTAAALTRKDKKVLIFSEVVTVITLLFITLVYDTGFFFMVIMPVMAAGLFINRCRVLFLVFKYWPSVYLNRKS